MNKNIQLQTREETREKNCRRDILSLFHFIHLSVPNTLCIIGVLAVAISAERRDNKTEPPPINHRKCSQKTCNPIKHIMAASLIPCI